MSTEEAPYGYCPECGAKGISRERRIDGYDICANRHKYKSKHATEDPTSRPYLQDPCQNAFHKEPLTKLPDTTRITIDFTDGHRRCYCVSQITERLIQEGEMLLFETQHPNTGNEIMIISCRRPAKC